MPDQTSAGQPSARCVFRKVVDEFDQFDSWELVECSCKKPGGYCMTPDNHSRRMSISTTDSLGDDDNDVEAACYEIGRTTPELPPEDPSDLLQPRSRIKNSGLLSLAVYFRLPVIERNSTTQKYFTGGRWNQVSIPLTDTNKNDLSINNWRLSVRKIDEIQNQDTFILPELKPMADRSYLDIAVPIMIGLPESGDTEGSIEIKHYWLLTSNKYVASVTGRPYGAIFTREWVVFVSRPIVSEI